MSSALSTHKPVAASGGQWRPVPVIECPGFDFFWHIREELADALRCKGLQVSL